MVSRQDYGHFNGICCPGNAVDGDVMDVRYTALESFNDRKLKSIIPKGGTYPPKGRNVPQEWIDILLSDGNAVGRPVIKPEEKPKRTYTKRGKGTDNEIDVGSLTDARED